MRFDLIKKTMPNNYPEFWIIKDGMPGAVVRYTIGKLELMEDFKARAEREFDKYVGVQRTFRPEVIKTAEI